MASKRYSSLEEILIDKEIITADQAEKATDEAKRTGKKFADILVLRKITTREIIIESICEIFGYTYRNISDINVPKEMSKVLSRHTAETNGIVALEADDLNVLIAVPVRLGGEIPLKDRLANETKRPFVEFIVSDEEQIKRLQKELYNADDELVELGSTNVEAQEEGVERVEDIDEEAVIVDESESKRLVRLALEQAVLDKASDLKFENHEKFMLLRYKVDGKWHQKTKIAKNKTAEIASIIKLQSNMNISNRFGAQDGRMFVDVDNQRFFLRVNIYPSQFGENITMRILDDTQANMELAELGFSLKNYNKYIKAINQPYGTILVTGPTGSGKSVTLYSSLRKIATTKKNVLTIEDPIEYSIPHVIQSQLNEKQGWTYPEAIRAFMRAAPEIILVGEMRDYDTAAVGLQAGMTGHLVLSTLHTNSACEAPSRLMDLGIQSHIISATLTAVVAQRLVRRLCAKCKIPHTPTANELLAVGYTVDNIAWNEEMDAPTGLYISPPEEENNCKECQGIGFKGRTGVHEVLLIDEKLRSMIANKAESHVIEEYATSAGFSTMIEDGWEKVSAGITTIGEVLDSVRTNL